MDMKLLGRALWRFKWIAAVGLVAAVGLTFISTFKFSNGKLSYRQSEQVASYSQIFVTEQGFPWGALEAPAASQDGRLTSLALIYANLADSDPVKRLMAKMGPPIPGAQIQAAALTTSPGSTDALPIISIAGIAGSPQDSLALTTRDTDALVAYIRDQQAANGIRNANRVVVQVIKHPGQVTVLKGRSKTVPVMVFLAVLILVIAVVLVLENMRPRIRKVERGEKDEPVASHTLSA
jgi:hypothetical protein